MLVTSKSITNKKTRVQEKFCEKFKKTMLCFWWFYFTRFQKSGSKSYRNDIFTKKLYKVRKIQNESYETRQDWQLLVALFIGALLETFPSISYGIQHFDRDLRNPAKGTQMIHSKMISHNFNQWIYRILTAIYHKYKYNII